MPARQTDPAARSGDQRRPAWQARLALPAGLLAAGVLLVVVVTEPLQALLSTQAVTLSGAVWPALAALTAYVAARAVRPRAF